MSMTMYGPAGGLGGNPIDNYIIPENARITAVYISAEQFIDAIQLAYTVGDSDSKLHRLGGIGGSDYAFTLEEDEYITGISGSSGWYIDELCIHTNKRQSPMYSEGSGSNPFSFMAPEGEEVVGFFGRADWYIDALGIVTRPRPVSTTSPSLPKPIVTKSVSLPPETPVEKGEPRPKDLQKVEGIGPKIASLLVEKGIYNLSDLAKTPVETLEDILKSAGRRYAIAKPATWPEQAALGAAGDWKAMKALQAELKGGRRVK